MTSLFRTKLVSALAAGVLVGGGALLTAHVAQEPAPATVQTPVQAPAQPPAQEAAPPALTAPPGYVWAGACKDCHKEIFAVWENTKHARALNRLSKEEQQKDCIGCHATGVKGLIEENGKPINAGVQCESCHGPGAAHAADPTKKLGPVVEGRCTVCHSDKSPHFRGFYFKGMADLSHPVKKT